MTRKEGQERQSGNGHWVKGRVRSRKSRGSQSRVPVLEAVRAEVSGDGEGDNTEPQAKISPGAERRKRGPSSQTQWALP